MDLITSIWIWLGGAVVGFILGMLIRLLQDISNQESLAEERDELDKAAFEIVYRPFADKTRLRS